MKRKIFAFTLILVALISSIVAFIAYNSASRIYFDEISKELRHDAAFVAYILTGEDWVSNNRINDSGVKSLADLTGDGNVGTPDERRITIIAADGRVLADTFTESAGMENHAGRPEVVGALKNGIGSDIRSSATVGDKFFYLAMYVKDINLIVRVAAPLTSIDDIRNTIVLNALGTILIAIIVSAVIAKSFSSYVTRPVARLVGQYGKDQIAPEKSGIRKHDEIGQLSVTLEGMAKRVEGIILELKDRNARVDTIINSMENGLVAVDRDMRVIIMNPITKKIFDVKDRLDEIGKPLIQVLRNRRLNEMLEKSIRTDEVMRDEEVIYHGGKQVISITVSPIYPIDRERGNSGALAFINDITAFRKLEEMRTEFVSNVTHELKTPLTSIRGFVETLKNGALEDRTVSEKFLDIIDIEADRLSTLINDILALSEIENMKQDQAIGTFTLKDLATEVAEMLGPTACEKQVKFNNLVDPDIAMQANRDRIKQLLINLMDNAVKYNKPGGGVDIWAERNKDTIHIHVKDTGIGISEDNRSRIFERFYRVDKGRSREMGGTGLGLSIVKHIANLYNGNVRVLSIEGKGSEFIVSIQA